MKAKGEVLIAALRDGKASSTAPQEGQAWKTVEAASRNQEGFDGAVLNAVFQMPKPTEKSKPTFASVALRDGSLVVLRLNGVNEGAMPSDQEKAEFSRALASRQGQMDFAAFRNQLHEKAEVKRY